MTFGFIKDMTVKKDKLVVGLDIGTSKVSVVVAEVTAGEQGSEELNSGHADRVNVLGFGTALSKGIKKGVVTNIETTVEAIKEAVKKAALMADVDIKAVQVGITGEHISCLSSNGVIALKEKEIGQREIESVLESAKAVAIPFDREMLHVIPSEFSVDGQDSISDPRGMSGVRLETNVKIVTGASTPVRNILKSCERAGLEVIDLVVNSLASAEAVLTQDEKDLGTVVIDMGAGTTDIVLFHEGSICHTAVIPIGGNNFTNDIAIGLRIPRHDAEKIKKENGCAMLSLVREDEEIELSFENERTDKGISRRYLVEIIQPRAEELFGLIMEEIRRNGFHSRMNSGVVLTGGAVCMEGLDVMAEHILELPVRTGTPRTFGGGEDITDDPAYSTAAGLTVFGLEENLTAQGFKEENIFTGFKDRVMGWMGEMFS